MSWWAYLFCLYFLFYGTKRNDEVTRVCFFGMTLYERRRDPSLPAPTTTFALGAGATEEDVEDEEEQDEESEADERDLWERLEGAGFRLIDDERDLRIGDVGSIVPEEMKKTKCEACKCQMYALSEVYASQLPEGGIGRAYEMKLGAICENCGSYLPIDVPTNGSTVGVVGKLPPLLDPHLRPNFFDVLEYLERVRGGDSKAAAEGADPAFLAQRRDQLEAELNQVRTAIMREKHKNGEGDAYREADRALAPDD